MTATAVYSRVLLKVSGEALMGDGHYGLDSGALERIARDVQTAHALDVGVCLVVGGGNIFRGMAAAAGGMDRSTADQMGMLATVMNALAMQNALEDIGVPTRVQSAIPMPAVCESYIRRRALRHIEKRRAVIFAAGTGNPFFTTDSAAALRASEMGCQALFKGTKVDGVYASDPNFNPSARRYPHLSFRDVLTRDLGVMDHSAVSLARENDIPILVFSIERAGAFPEILKGGGDHTIVDHTPAAGEGNEP